MGRNAFSRGEGFCDVGTRIIFLAEWYKVSQIYDLLFGYVVYQSSIHHIKRFTHIDNIHRYLCLFLSCRDCTSVLSHASFEGASQ